MANKSYFAIPLIFLTLGLMGFHVPKVTQKTIFTQDPPEKESIRDEIRYMESVGRLTKEQQIEIDRHLQVVQDELHVPKAILWCIFFQESRLNPFMNATTKSWARGLGQFTPAALSEINDDTNNYDSRTGDFLESQLELNSKPINFQIKTHTYMHKQRKKVLPAPVQSKYSYFNLPTAIYSSAAYVNNRYHQIKSTLDRQKIKYNPDVLWLFAAAAYNKGARTVFILLTKEYSLKGHEGLRKILQDPKASYNFLTQRKRIDHSINEIWGDEKRVKYGEELLRHIQSITSCAVAEEHL